MGGGTLRCQNRPVADHAGFSPDSLLFLSYIVIPHSTCHIGSVLCHGIFRRRAGYHGFHHSLNAGGDSGVFIILRSEISALQELCGNLFEGLCGIGFIGGYILSGGNISLCNDSVCVNLRVHKMFDELKSLIFGICILRNG